jgi:hypothetical protein
MLSSATTLTFAISSPSNLYMTSPTFWPASTGAMRNGSRVLSGILPKRQYFKIMQYENHIAVIFLLLIFIFPGILYKVMFPFIWLLETSIRFIAMPLLKILL